MQEKIVKHKTRYRTMDGKKWICIWKMQGDRCFNIKHTQVA